MEEKFIDLMWEVKEGKKHPNRAYKELCVLFNVSVRFPSHAELTKEALNVLGGDSSEQNIQRHKDYIAGGVWMLDECNKKFNER